MPRPIRAEVTALPRGEGCENCNGTGFIHAEGPEFPDDRDGCVECQKRRRPVRR